jgi:rfaE bifunctional protein nucleotidyltransferase chain/domain
MSHLDRLKSKIYENAIELSTVLNAVRSEKRIVFTNGCFDILHRGHVTYLNRARDLGDLLVVAVNSDASVKRLKGPTRPIHSAQDRAYVLAALACVDYVILFHEDTPTETIRILKPHLHTKGGDYRIEDLPEKRALDEYGGSIVLIPFVDGYSTSTIIEKMGTIQ